MRLPLVWLQHLLIAAPAIATLYEADIPATGPYVICVLLALLYARLLPLAPGRYTILLISLGMIAFSWFFHEYGGLLYFLQYSLLVSAVLGLQRPAELGLAIVLSGAVLNTGAAALPADTVWTMNLVWLTVALFVAAVFIRKRQADRLEKAMETLAGSQEQLEQERARALEYARKVEDYAQVQERGRIAAELHDDLGHRLIRVKMMTEAALQLMERHPVQATGLIEQVRGQLEESMNNMRYTVRRLQPRDSAGARRYALHRLIEDAARDLRIEVDFAVTGHPFPLYPSLEFVLYRNAQEAITNAVRHGGATSVAVELRFAEDRIAMDVSNNGAPPEKISPGMGLKGMQDRLAVVGGRLRIETEPRFVVSTIVPHSQNRPAHEKENLQ
ncbi:sensor histidine kinase [Cohnella cellulosilytica]|uniref:histidine kinase n=1 Tax=Cohnella cellulosilytica TaxID=986710 RepID=A0ABW2FE63_9BACL